ncbi:spore coat protein U domain-containing protein [Enterobacter bugandensis]|uniref:spore coat protein U domain-containing protein n=1 Tax=Enterobacter bugandensis TaxID=881260 RepID=UPI0021579FD4|nr:spore coat protein U domain-containing protein [Enterobacter bugandensis]MCR6710378.1 spore coat protein U domain-containing protein [Enterobacter bugandensis]
MNIIRFLLLFILTAGSGMSFAACTNNASTQTLNINFGSIIAQRDVLPGTSVATKTGYYSMNFTCTDTNNTYQETMYFNALGNNLYDIGISGYGLRLSQNDTNLNLIHYFPTGASLVGTQNGTYRYKAEIVRTSGAQGSGNFLTGKLADASIVNQFYIASWYVTGGSITTTACSLNTGSLSFPMGNIPTTSFGSTVGTTSSSAQVTQNLGLTCNPGANINVSLSGQQNPDVSNTSVLALSNQGLPGVAQGIGVQVLYGGVPLNLNGNVLLKQSTGGAESLPIVVRYYQTKPNIAPGSANATATLNITYQ